MNVFHKLIPLVEKEMIVKPAKIKEIKKIIRQMKRSNSNGNYEVTNNLIKEIAEYCSLAITLLENKIR